MNQTQWQKASKYLLISALALSFACKDDDDDKVAPPDNIWTGPELSFTKAKDADWTLPANQDKISDKVVFTRQDKGPLYNYQWWIDNFDADATSDDLENDFWGGEELEFTPVGGTTGVRWAILDDTGAEDTEAWTEFNLYGKLGEPTNFYSFHSIASIIRALDDDQKVIGVPDDFSCEVECNDCGDEEGPVSSDGTEMPSLVGKKLAIWLVEEDVYLTLTFTHWGTGREDNVAVSYTRSTKD